MAESQPKYTRRPFPNHSLEESLSLAQAIQNQNYGKPMNRVLLATAIQKKPASSDYKALLSSASKYGLTVGTEKSDSIALTGLGESITHPRTVAERVSSLRKAALQPEVLQKIYEHYNNGKLPQGAFFLNVLERDFKVPRDRCEECAQLISENGRFVGLLRELQGSQYIILDEDSEEVRSEPFEPVGENTEPDASSPAVNGDVGLPSKGAVMPGQRFIFIAHGRNRKPLDQLEKILGQFKIPFKVAVEEPQMFRPISGKVAQLMKECHLAIVIFTADEEFRTPDGEQVVWRPSQNVIYELGAASVLYENRVVILKEDGLDFPTDFKDIGHISFEKDRLDAKGTQLIAELIGLGLMRVEPV